MENSRSRSHRTRVLRRTFYHLATPAVAQFARSEAIYKEQRFSDHAPITVEYDFQL